MKKRLLITLILFISRQNLFAQTPHFRNYTVDDGLPSSHVYRAFQDSKGFMWFCTDKGIARFDGYKFEKFTTKNGLPNNDVWHCAEDSEQRIWFLSYANAFFYFDLKDNKFHVIENPYKNHHDSHIWCYTVENKAIIRIILSDKSTLKINLVDKTVVKIESDITVKYPLIKNKYFYNSGRFYFEHWYLRAFSEGLQHNLLNKPHILPNINTINKSFWQNVITIIFDDDKTIYGNDDSLTFFKNNRFHSKKLNLLTRYKDDKLSLVLNAGSPYRKMIVTEKDLFIVNENLERIKNLDFIGEMNPNTVFFDSDENTWICTKNNGVYLLSKKSIDSKIFEQFSKQSITTITKDYFGRIWFGNNLGEVFYINKKNTISNLLFNEIKRSPIRQILTSPTKITVIWFNSDLAIFRYNKENIFTKRFKNILSTNPSSESNEFVKIIEKTKHIDGYIFERQNVKTVSLINKDKILLGTASNLRIIDDNPSNYKFHYIDKGILSLKVLATKSVNGKDIFVGTNKGIEFINEAEKLSNLTSIKQKYPILTKPISCFADDTQNALWTGTDGYGVYRFHQNVATEIPELKGMIINYLYSEKENNRL